MPLVKLLNNILHNDTTYKEGQVLEVGDETAAEWAESGSAVLTDAASTQVSQVETPTPTGGNENQ